MIARRFNMVTELGKLLDPVADKATFGAMLICDNPSSLDGSDSYFIRT